jgi:hypothetical protein
MDISIEQLALAGSLTTGLVQVLLLTPLKEVLTNKAGSWIPFINIIIGVIVGLVIGLPFIPALMGALGSMGLYDITKAVIRTPKLAKMA